jgi:hypothetical protein
MHLKIDVQITVSFLNELLATPQATCAVCELAGTGLRDGEEGVIELPPSFSKRSMYSRFIGDRDYDVELDPRGGITAIRKVGESLACQPICSWFKFRTFWKEAFLLL